MATEKDKPQNLPKGLRPETLGQLLRDEKRLEREFSKMDDAAVARQEARRKLK